MLFLTLFYTFFLIGLFGFGGGYGMLSLIQHEVVINHHWISSAEFTNIVAISQMTPGPIGINSATYCGYTAVMNQTGDYMLSILGSITSTFALVLPSFILMMLISMLFLKYMENHYVKMIFAGLRPAVVGLLAAAALMLCTEDNFGNPIDNRWTFYISIFIFLATFIGVKFVRVHPIAMLAHAAFAGLLLLY